MSSLTLRPVVARSMIFAASLAIALTGLVYVEQNSASGAPATTQSVSGSTSGASTADKAPKEDKPCKPPKGDKPEKCKPSKG